MGLVMQTATIVKTCELIVKMPRTKNIKPYKAENINKMPLFHFMEFFSVYVKTYFLGYFKLTKFF